MKKTSLATLVIALTCIASSTSWSETASDKRTVSVQGSGQIRAVPDIATLRVEVNADGKALPEVTAEVRKKMQSVLATIKQSGIPDKDVQTQQYSIQPRYEYANGRSKRIGYYVSNQVAVTVRDLTKTGALLTAVTESGANQVMGPDFAFDEPKILERKALAKAMDDARERAEILAKAAGATLGPVQTISESGVSWPGPQPKFMAMARMQAANVESAPEPIASGEQSLTANVSVSFLLR